MSAINGAVLLIVVTAWALYMLHKLTDGDW